MALGHSPRIVTDGMVLYLDAANPKNYNLTEVEVLVVAGGGAGGGGIGGGGGGGGVIYMPSANINPGTSYTITVGAGGAAALYGATSGSGGDSSAFGALAKGGGGSGVHDSGDGVTGGSGGGAASNNGRINVGGSASGSSLGGNTGTIYGNRGGNMLVSRTGGPTAAAGGGGAGTAAADTNSNIVQTSPGDANGRGGDGILNSILGTPYYWGGGGGGGAYFNGYAGNGGLGGGGGGSCSGGSGPTSGGGSALNSGSGAAIDTNGGAGGTNTGGGGGGGAWQVTSGGSGGSGIVIVKYQGPQKAIGGTIISNNGYTIHTFTTVGSTTFTPLVATNNSAVLGLSDLSGRGNFGTTVNSPTYSSANGGSLVFDGVDDYVSGSIPTTNSWSMTLWCRSTDITSQLVFYPFSGSPASGLGFGGTFNANTNNRWYFLDGTNTFSNSNTAVTTNVWYNLVVTKSSTTYNLYTNGSLSLNGSGVDLSLTQYNLGRRGDAVWYFKGNISNAKIYNRALSAAEVSQNFNATRGRFGI